MPRTAPIALALALLLAATTALAAPPKLKLGDKAPDFTLKTPAGDPVHLADLTAKGPVVLVVLRGWPGYQCPLCTRQVGEILARSRALAEARAHVVLVYPGPAADLKAHAEEFAGEIKLPANVSYVIDPDFHFTNLYGLRWDAPKETAYPSTFVIDPKGQITFAQTSRTHGGRASIDSILAALASQ